MPILADLLTPAILEMIGVLGFAIYVLNYALLTINKLKSEHMMYFVLNWLAATFVLIGLTASFNLASALIQVFWIGISTIGIMIRLRAQRRPTFSSIRNRGFSVN